VRRQQTRFSLLDFLPPATLLVASLLCQQCLALQAPVHHPKNGRQQVGHDTTPPTGDAKSEKTIYDYALPHPDGKDLSLATFRGKYLLIVNLARRSTYNDQLAALVTLYDRYKDKGLIVLGVPSNDFGAGEPGTQTEILKAYTDAKVDFPIMSVSKLTGDAGLPLFTYLTKSKGAPAGGPVHWNFTKFVVDKKGMIVARLEPDVAPDSPEMLATLDEILLGTYKPATPKDKPSADSGDDDDE